MSTLRNKLWCVILSLALLINLLPVSALALEAQAEQHIVQHWVEDPPVEATEKTEQQLITEVPEENSAVIVREDISLRNEFTKHFEMSDGSYTATVYNEPVHQFVDGMWVEVDNSLQLSTSTKGVAQYQTVNGLTDVSFAQNFDNELVTMEEDGYSITWGVEAVADLSKMAAVASARLTDNVREPSQAEILPMDLSAVAAEEQKTFATKATSTIRYADALASGVNLEYTVLPSRIKESIILGSPQSISEYIVTVNTSDLSARLLDNREVEFYTEDGETVFTMWAPYMYDSASELSEDIAVELAALGNGQYAITLVPDAAWLNSPDRVYPIVIDPDVSVSRERTNILDNTVMEGQGNQNRNLDRLYIGRKSGARVRAFLKYDVMPTIPSNATITAATQTLYITSGTDTGSTAGAYIVTGGDWGTSTITWANQPTAATAIQTSISHNNFSYYRFSCLSAVQKWYAGSTIGKNANYGIMVRYTDETINDYNAFYSADCSTESSRPLLTISYWVQSITVSSDIELVEGATCQLTPTVYPAGQTVTWTTTDASIATVSSNGVVTGKKAGVAVITATLPNGDYDCCMTLVTLSNGVYYIGNSGLYLGTDGSLEENTPAKLFGKTSARPAQLRQLWKIKHLGDGVYSIRPMYKLDMALHVTSNSVDITTIGALDSSVPAANRWRISYRANGYLFRPADAVTKAIRPINSTVYIGLGVATSQYDTSTIFNWQLEKLSDPPSGAILYDRETGSVLNNPLRWVAIGESKSVESFGMIATSYSGNTYNNSQKFTWSVNSSTTCITVNGRTGEITGISMGTALVTGTGSFGTVTFTVTVIPLPDGVYQIRNWASDKYVDISNTPIAVGTAICQRNFNASGNQRWVFTHLGNGSYSIKSAYPSAELYLGVYGDSSANNQPIVLRSGNLTGGVRWKIELTSNGTYILMPLTVQTERRVLSVDPSNTNLNGAELRQRTYINDTAFEDEWLISAVNDDIILESQQASLWCWVASARMASTKYMNSQISQASAAVYIKKGIRTLFPTDKQIEDSNSTGSLEEISNAINYILGFAGTYYADNKIYAEVTLRNLLDSGNIIIIARGQYATKSTREGGHVTVIYDYSYDAQSGIYVYHIYDPSPVDIGSYYERSYSWICDGRNNALPQEGVDDSIWDGIVTFKIGDYANVIDLNLGS